MQVANLLPQTDDYFQSYLFEEFIESHIPYLIDNFISANRNIPPNIASVFKGDLFSLLSYIAIPIDLHYILMRVNGFYSSEDFDGETTNLMVPLPSECTALKNVYKTPPKQN